MRKSRRPLSIRARQPYGGAVARLALGIIGALMLLAAPLCVAQAQSSECETMVMMSLEGGDHHDQSAPTAKPDCAVGCRLLPQLGPQVIAPMRVVYEVQFETEQRTPDGIVVDPAVPPPRGGV